MLEIFQCSIFLTISSSNWENAKCLGPLRCNLEKKEKEEKKVQKRKGQKKYFCPSSVKIFFYMPTSFQARGNTENFRIRLFHCSPTLIFQWFIMFLMYKGKEEWNHRHVRGSFWRWSVLPTSGTSVHLCLVRGSWRNLETPLSLSVIYSTRA